MRAAIGAIGRSDDAIAFFDVAEAIHQEFMDSFVGIPKGLAHACLLQNARASRDLEGALCGISACCSSMNHTLGNLQGAAIWRAELKKR
jgi:hypothetical protein